MKDRFHAMKNSKKRIHMITLLCFFIAATAVSAAVMSRAAVTKEKTIEIPKLVAGSEPGTSDHPFIVLEIVPYEGFAEFGYLVAGCEPVDLERVSWSSYGGVIPSSQSITAAGVSEPSFHYEYTNKNLFLKECLNLSDDAIKDYQIRVITVTSKQLNQNLSLIDRADLIYISDKSHNGEPFIKMWESEDFRRTDLFSYDEVREESFHNYNQIRFTNAGNDLSWEAVLKILQKKSGYELGPDVEPCPVIYDTSQLTSIASTASIRASKQTKNHLSLECNGNGSDNNVYKLGLFLIQGDTAKLYQMYIASGIITSVLREDGLTTGYYNDITRLDGSAKDPCTWWTMYTLIPYHLAEYLNYNYTGFFDDIKALGFHGYDAVPGNVMAMNGTFIFNADNSMGMTFSVDSVTKTDETKEAFEYYEHVYPRLTPFQIIRFLLDRKKAGTGIDSIRILEIEPADDFKSDADWYSYLIGLLPSFKGTLTIQRKSSKEFICAAENLSESYDLIYLGTNPGSLASRSYQDRALDGLVYMHTGDLVTMKNYIGAMNTWVRESQNYGVNNASFTTRLAGNDLTNVKMQQLSDYIQSGHAVIAGNGCYTNPAATPKIINTAKIDLASNIFTLLQTYQSSNAIFSEEYCNPYLLQQRLTNTYCRLVLYSQPEVYQDAKTAAEKGMTLSDTEVYVTQNQISYEFELHDLTAEAHYQITLGIDANADGSYTEDELIKPTQLIEVSTGSIADAKQLAANIRYRLTLKVSDRVGVLTWKLSANRVDASGTSLNIAAQQHGICAIKAYSDTQKQKLRILQITSVKTGDTVPGILLPTKAEIDTFNLTFHGNLNDPNQVADGFVGIVKDESNAPVADNIARACGLFYYYTKDLNDYVLTFERISVTEFEKKISRSELTLDDYNMLIIGFADKCTDFTSAQAVNAVKDMISKGKTVLFTHDTTYHQSTHKTSYEFREILGMDRYGAMLRLAKKSLRECIDEGKDAVYLPGRTQSTASVEDASRFGFTDQCVYRYAKDALYSKTTADMMTQTVTKVNDGQITKYPYEIPDTLTIAPTHYQYFQLDLEGPAIVVWYALANQGTNTGYDKNDGRNGYYIYNKGNITYSGAGHISSGSTNEVPKEEIKLFVNTIIAAHRATPKVTAQIINADKTTDSYGRDYLYVDYDANDAMTAVGNGISSGGSSQYKKIEYKTVNSTAATQKSLTVSYYLIPLTQDAETKRDTWTTLMLPTYRKNGSVLSDSCLQSDCEYYVEVPIEVLKNGDQMKIGIELTLVYGAENFTSKETTFATILRRGLFNLD